MLLLVSKHRYQTIPVSLKSAQVAARTYLPAAERDKRTQKFVFKTASLSRIYL